VFNSFYRAWGIAKARLTVSLRGVAIARADTRSALREDRILRTRLAVSARAVACFGFRTSWDTARRVRTSSLPKRAPSPQFPSPFHSNT